MNELYTDLKEDLQDMPNEWMFGAKFISIDKMNDEELKRNGIFRIEVSKKALDEMLKLVKENSEEVAWFGVIKNKSDTCHVLEDIYYFEQEKSAATVSMSGADYGKFIYEMSKKIGKDKIVDFINSVKLCGHSHVWFGCTPSCTDLDMIQNFSAHGLYTMLIMNKRNECKLYTFDFVNKKIFLQELGEKDGMPEKTEEPVYNLPYYFGGHDYFGSDYEYQYKNYQDDIRLCFYGDVVRGIRGKQMEFDLEKQNEEN